MVYLINTYVFHLGISDSPVPSVYGGGRNTCTYPTILIVKALPTTKLSATPRGTDFWRSLDGRSRKNGATTSSCENKSSLPIIY